MTDAPRFFLRRDHEIKIPALRRGRRHRRGSPPPPDGTIEELYDCSRPCPQHLTRPAALPSDHNRADLGGCGCGDGGGGCGSCEGSCGGSWGDSGAFDASSMSAGSFDMAASLAADAMMAGDPNATSGPGEWGGWGNWVGQDNAGNLIALDTTGNFASMNAPNAAPFVDPNPGVSTGPGDWGSAGAYGTGLGGTGQGAGYGAYGANQGGGFYGWGQPSDYGTSYSGGGGGGFSGGGRGDSGGGGGRGGGGRGGGSFESRGTTPGDPTGNIGSRSASDDRGPEAEPEGTPSPSDLTPDTTPSVNEPNTEPSDDPNAGIRSSDPPGVDPNAGIPESAPPSDSGGGSKGPSSFGPGNVPGGPTYSGEPETSPSGGPTYSGEPETSPAVSSGPAYSGEPETTPTSGPSYDYSGAPYADMGPGGTPAFDYFGGAPYADQVPSSLNVSPDLAQALNELSNITQQAGPMEPGLRSGAPFWDFPNLSSYFWANPNPSRGFYWIDPGREWQAAPQTQSYTNLSNWFSNIRNDPLNPQSYFFPGARDVDIRAGLSRDAGGRAMLSAYDFLANLAPQENPDLLGNQQSINQYITEQEAPAQLQTDIPEQIAGPGLLTSDPSAFVDVETSGPGAPQQSQQGYDYYSGAPYSDENVGTLPTDMFPGAANIPVENTPLADIMSIPPEFAGTALTNPGFLQGGQFADPLNDAGSISYPTDPTANAMSPGANPWDEPGYPATMSTVVETAAPTAPADAKDAAAAAAADTAARGGDPGDQAAAAHAAAASKGATPEEAQAIADGVYDAATASAARGEPGAQRGADVIGIGPAGKTAAPPGLLFEMLNSPAVMQANPQYNPDVIAQQAVNNAFLQSQTPMTIGQIAGAVYGPTQPGQVNPQTIEPSTTYEGAPYADMGPGTPNAPPASAPPGAPLDINPPTTQPGQVNINPPSLLDLVVPGGGRTTGPDYVAPGTQRSEPVGPAPPLGLTSPGVPPATVPPGTFNPPVEPGQPGAPPSYARYGTPAEDQTQIAGRTPPTPSEPPPAQPAARPPVEPTPPPARPNIPTDLPILLPGQIPPEFQGPGFTSTLGRQSQYRAYQTGGRTWAFPASPGRSFSTRPPASPQERIEFDNWYADVPTLPNGRANPYYYDRGPSFTQGRPGVDWRTAQQAGIQPKFKVEDQSWQFLSADTVQALNDAWDRMNDRERASFVLNSAYRPATRNDARTLGLSDYQSQESVHARGNARSAGFQGATNFPNASPDHSRHGGGRAVDVIPGPARDWLQAHMREVGLEPVRGDAPHSQLISGNLSRPSAAERAAAIEQYFSGPATMPAARPAVEPAPPARGRRSEAPTYGQMAQYQDFDPTAPLPGAPESSLPGSAEWEAGQPNAPIAGNLTPGLELLQPAPPAPPPALAPDLTPGLDRGLPPVFEQRASAPGLLDMLGNLLSQFNPISTAQAKMSRDDIAALNLARTGTSTGGQPGHSVIGHNIFTFYAPGASGPRGIEGPYIGSQGNALYNLDDVRSGRSNVVSLAAHPSQFGKEIFIGNITYKSPIDGKTYVLENVVGRVDDTGGKFRSEADNPDHNKFDIAVGDFRGGKWNDATADAFTSGNTAQYVGEMPAIEPRAEGGPVKKGKPYLVGERGPEVIVPDQPGTVYPYTAPLGKGDTYGRWPQVLQSDYPDRYAGLGREINTQTGLAQDIMYGPHGLLDLMAIGALPQPENRWLTDPRLIEMGRRRIEDRRGRSSD